MATKHEQLAQHLGHFLLALRQGQSPRKSRETIAKLLQDTTHPDIQSFLLHELVDVEHQHKALVGPIHSINRDLQGHLCQLQGDCDELETTQERLLIEHARLEKRHGRRKAENKLLYQENCDLRTEMGEREKDFMRLRRKYERLSKKNEELTRTLVEMRNSLSEFANGKFDSTAMAGGILCGVLANLLSAKVLKGL